MTDKRLIQLYNWDRPINEIAVEAEMSEGHINNRLIDLRADGKIGYRGKSANHSRVQTGNERKAKILELRLAGKENKEIAEELELNEVYVRGIASQLIKAGKLKKRVNRFTNAQDKEAREAAVKPKRKPKAKRKARRA